MHDSTWEFDFDGDGDMDDDDSWGDALYGVHARARDTIPTPEEAAVVVG